MPANMDPLGQLMNPLQPPARNPPVPNATMVAPQAPPQPQPTAPQQPPVGIPPAAGLPPQMPPGQMSPGQPPTGATPPTGAPPGSMIMPQRMPDILQLLMSRMANAQPNGGLQNGLQSAPLTGQPPTVGGQ